MLPDLPFLLNRISAIAPPKKRSKNDARGRDQVEINREIVAGLEYAAKHQRALERTGSYPNLNQRLTVSDPLPFRSVKRLLADISAGSTNTVNCSNISQTSLSRSWLDGI